MVMAMTTAAAACNCQPLARGGDGRGEGVASDNVTHRNEGDRRPVRQKAADRADHSHGHLSLWRRGTQTCSAALPRFFATATEFEECLAGISRRRASCAAETVLAAANDDHVTASPG